MIAERLLNLNRLTGRNERIAALSTNHVRRYASTNYFSNLVMSVLGNYKSTKIKRVFVLEKITKYDLEIKNGLTPNQILQSFPLAYNTHITHKKIMESLLRHLRDVYKLETRVAKAQTKGLVAFESSSSNDRPRPDLIISAGGDGTFLEAASLIPADQLCDTPIWLAGVNTDPERSLGNLCMSYYGPKNEQHFNCGYYDYEKCQNASSGDPEAQESDKMNVFDKNLKAFCSYTYQRPVEKKIVFKDQTTDTLKEYQKKYVNMVTYDEYVNTLLHNLLNFKLHPIPRQRVRLKLFKKKLTAGGALQTYGKGGKKPPIFIENKKIEKILLTNTDSEFEHEELDNDYSEGSNLYRLPHGVVNDVMIADKDFGKTFYAIVQVDNKPLKRVKSSGVLVTTGTGSTAWAYNVNKMNFFAGTSFVKCLLEHPEVPESVAKSINDTVIKETIECFNQKLKMDPSRALMRCIIREPISTRTTQDTSFYNCTVVKVVPLSKNAVVCVDGSKSIKLEYGDVVVLKIFESDLIWSLI